MGGFWFYFAVIVFPLIFVYILVIAANRPFQVSDKSAFAAAPFAGALLALMMSGLTVTIDDLSIEIRFGPGRFWKTYPLTPIANCQPVRSGWRRGWGIRWHFKGWRYNIDGLAGVESTFKNGKKAGISTDEPEKRTLAIEGAIK